MYDVAIFLRFFFFFIADSRIMKFSLTRSFLVVIAFAVLATAEEWSWSKDKTKDGQDNKSPVTDSTEVAAASRESKSIDSYSEVNDDSSGSPEDGISAAVNGSDTQPRHVIKDRLCGLGLMEVRTFMRSRV